MACNVCTLFVHLMTYDTIDKEFGRHNFLFVIFGRFYINDVVAVVSRRSVGRSADFPSNRKSLVHEQVRRSVKSSQSKWTGPPKTRLVVVDTIAQDATLPVADPYWITPAVTSHL
jgi:hypothetical protein